MPKGQRIDLDLEKNTDLASLIADLEPGEMLDLRVSIVAKTDKTLTVELEEASECEPSDDEEMDDDEGEMMDEASDEPDSPAMRVARGKK